VIDLEKNGIFVIQVDEPALRVSHSSYRVTSLNQS
jgi:methionine synthase II (cobalamin-independent)